MRAVTNGLWNASANLAGAFTGGIGSIIIVRTLTPEAYGAFSYYLWLAGIFGILGTLAFPASLTKIMSELRGQQQHIEAHALARWTAVILVGCNLLLGIGLAAWGLATPDFRRTYILIIAVSPISNALAAILRSTLWGNERYKPVSLAASTASLLQLILILVAYLAELGAPGFVAAALSSSVLQSLGLLLAVWRSNRRDGKATVFHLPSRNTLRRYLAFSAPNMLSMLFSMIVWERSEVFFLERFSGLEQVGYYSLAYTVSAVFSVLGWALVSGFFPAISKDYGAGEWARVRENVRRGVVLAIVYAVPLSFGGWVTMGSLITLVYGSAMLPAVPVAQVLFLGLLPGVIAAVFGLTLGAAGGIWMNVRLGAVLALVNVGLDLLLIPSLGALGGALANTGSQLLYTFLLLIAAYRLYRVAIPLRTLGLVLVVGGLTTFVVPVIVQAWVPGIWGLAWMILLGGCLYMTAIWRLGYFQRLRGTEVVA